MSSTLRIAAWLTPSKVALLALAFLLATKWPQLDQPPVWDGSKSVFPAAITLAQSNFDLPHLLQQPSYFDGGPNIHGLSLVTWVTALAYWALGDRPDVILPLLHLLHLAITAWALATLWRIARDGLGSLAALGAVGTVAVFPLFFVQAGYLYLEMPILAFSAAAIYSWLQGRDRQTAAWATAAAMVKSSGTIVAGALLVSTLATPGDWRRKLRRCALLTAGPLIVAAVHYALHPSSALGVGSLDATVAYLLSVPDLALLLVVFVGASLALRPWRSELWETRLRGTKLCGRNQGPARVYLICVATFVSFCGFYLALVPLGASVRVLPRYYLQLFPFVLIGLLVLLGRRSRRAVAGVLLVAALFFLANRKGHLYPDRGTTNFAITERSMAYVELMELQDLGLQSLVEAAGEMPVFYGLSESYRLAYPEMGHDHVPPAEGHCIYNEAPYLHARLRDFPPTFFVLYDYPWLGGAEARRVVSEAESDPRYDVEVAQLTVGPFESYLARVALRESTAGIRPPLR